MPQVPYQPLQTVQPNQPLDYQRIQANPEAFGAGVGRATQQLGGQIGQFGDVLAKHQDIFIKEQNATQVDEANIAFEQGVRDTLFGGPDSPGFYSLKGADAYKAMPETAKKIEELRASVKGQLANPEQEKMYDYITRRSLSRDLYTMSSHAATENRNWRINTAKGSINNEINNTSVYWNDDKRFQYSLENIKIQAERLAKLEGIDSASDAGKAMVSSYQSQAVEARVRGIAAHDPNLAQEVLDRTPDGLIDAKHKASLVTYLENRQFTFSRAKEAEAARIEREAKDRVREEQDNIQKGFLQRFVAGKLTTADVLGSDLPANMQEHWINNIKAKAKESKDESQTKVNQRLTQQFFSGIVNGKVTEADQILSAVRPEGGLDMEHALRLVGVLDASSKPGGLKYGHMIDQAGRTATKILSNDLVSGMFKDQIPEAVNKFMFELADRVAKSDNPRSLVDPNSKDNMLRPEVIKQFMPTAAVDLGAAVAEKITPEAAALAEQGVVTIKNDAEYDTLAKGSRFRGPDGKNRVKP